MLENKYNHLNVEKGKYDVWKNKGYFSCGDKLSRNSIWRYGSSC